MDMWQKTAMNIDGKFATRCFRICNTSHTGNVLLQIPIEHASQQTYEVGHKNVKLENEKNLSSSSEEVQTFNFNQMRAEGMKFHSYLHNSSQLQNITAHLLRPLTCFSFHCFQLERAVISFTMLIHN